METSTLERVTEIFRVLTAAGFVLTGAGAVRTWLRVRGKARGAMAGALGSLGLVALLGQVSRWTDYSYPLIGDVSLVAFAISGYMLLIFRHAYLPIARWVLIASTVVTAGVTAWVFVLPLPYGETATLDPDYQLAVLALVGVWTALVGEPAYRFWRVSKDRPAVQRARLRSLSIAYTTIAVVLFVAVLGNTGRHPLLALIIQIVAFVLIGVIWVAVSPPSWLRRAWRAREEEKLLVSEDLITFADNRVILAERAIEWAIRLTGAVGGFIVDADQKVLAVRDFDESAALSFAAKAHRVSLIPMGGDTDDLIILSELPTGRGTGALGVRSGPFTLLFGSDEQQRLGRHATLVGIALDRVRATEELRALDSSRREFISNAAHELRTPLTAILGLASLLEDEQASFGPDETKEMVTAIHRQARRMRALVNNLLDLSQIEQGKLSVTVDTVPLRPAIDSVIATTPPPDGVSVSVDADPSLAVRADPVRLEQILTNLVSNAFRYGAATVAVRAHRDEGNILVSVADDGPGVAQDVLPHLFEPFARSRSVTATEGYGLGLAIVKGLAQAQGGDIWYESASGNGARFVLRLKEAG